MNVWVVEAKNRFSDLWVPLRDRDHCGFATHDAAQAACDAMTAQHGPDWMYRVVEYRRVES